jgi:hypothetical protein
LEFWLTRSAAREQHSDTLRSQAYADYLRAVAAAGHLRADEDLRDAHRDAADAKARIAVYGTAEAIKALSDSRRLVRSSSTGQPRGHSLLSPPACTLVVGLSRTGS